MPNPARTAEAAAAQLGCTIDDVLFLQIVKTNILIAAATGQLDLAALAKCELANRGFGKDGEWVGFDAARRCWEV